jgi:hypothetical protein
MRLLYLGTSGYRPLTTHIRVEQSKIQYHLKYNIIWIIHNTGGSLDGLSRIFCTAATSMRWTTAAADIVTGVSTCDCGSGTTACGVESMARSSATSPDPFEECHTKCGTMTFSQCEGRICVTHPLLLQGNPLRAVSAFIQACRAQQRDDKGTESK